MFKLGLTLAAGMLFSSVANADLVSTDWLVSGDSKVTLDTQTGIEWLDISLTTGKSVAEVQALLDTTYSGWEIANRQQVYYLFKNNLTVDLPDDIYQRYVTTLHMGAFMTEASELIELFDGYDFGASNSIWGYFLSEPLEGGADLGRGIISYREGDQYDSASLDLVDSENFRFNESSPWIGTYLVKTSVADVPLLSSGLGIFGLALLAGVRRKKLNS